MAPKSKARKPRKKGRKGKNKLALGRLIHLRPDITVTLRESAANTIYNNSVVEETFAYVYAMNQAQNYTNYTAIFDQYRINWIEARFVNLGPSSVNKPYDDNSGTLAPIPRFCIARDRDDASTGTSFDDLRARSESSIHLMTKGFTIRFIPNRLSMLYWTPSSTAYKLDLDTKAWLDCAQTSIPHYGHKIAVEVASPSNAYKMQIEYKYNISFRGRRD